MTELSNVQIKNIKPMEILIFIFLLLASGVLQRNSPDRSFLPPAERTETLVVKINSSSFIFFLDP
jgi:hypothetical protein